MASKTLMFMREVFSNVQFNRTSHQTFLTKLKKCYEHEDLQKFTEAFISCLMIPLTYSEKHPHIENTLEFAAKFAVSLHHFKDDSDDEQMCQFLMLLFDFLLEHHNAKNQSVRFRVCHFLNMLLNSMGDDAFIEDCLCDKITGNMMERLMDKSPKVRAQAVFALHRLQDPTDDQCPVIRMYIFHLSKDPNTEVRKAVLTCMAKNQKALQAVLKRTRDINESVRKMSYEFISKITVKSLTIKQREGLLNDGLKDRSELVSKTVRKVLLPSWLQHLGGEYAKLLRALDVESSTDTAILALNALLKGAEMSKLLEQLATDPVTKLIPADDLTSEKVLYWRCLVEHFHRENCSDYIEQVLPELTKFCDYVREYLNALDAREGETGGMVSEKFVLYQLFEIAKTYDLADESGRASLTRLILDTLLSDNCSEKITECIVKYFELVVPDVQSRLDSLVHVISEIKMPTRHTVPTQVPEQDDLKQRFEKAELRVQLMELQDEEYEMIQKRDFLKAQELKEKIEQLAKTIDEMTNRNKAELPEEICSEKNDPETMIRCLTITCCMIAAKSVTTLTATLRSLLENLAQPSLDHENNTVHILALKAVALFCLLDKDMAKKYIMMYFLQFSFEQDHREIWVIALQSIFDLLLQYGLEFFDIVQDHDDTTETTTGGRRSKTVRLYNNTEDDITGVSLQSEGNTQANINFVKILTGLLDNADQEVRTIATEGLCKLILHGRIRGSHLLSRLVILLYNPISEDDVYLRQCLCTFFKTYVTRVPDSQEMLELAFMPTLKTIANAPDMSPLQGIEPCHVAKFLLGITSSRNHKPGSESYTVHNNLALSILAEALDDTSEVDKETLLRCLKYLDVCFEDKVLKENLREAADKIVAAMDESEKRLVKYIEQFKSKFDAVEVVEESQQEVPASGEAVPETESDE